MFPLKNLVALWSLMTFGAITLSAQAVRFDSASYTPNAACVAGGSCPILAIPGTTVKICNGVSSPCQSTATTYQSASAVAACPAAAQVAPSSTSESSCAATADGRGNFGVWLKPGAYSYYLTLPATAGGATFGPYPFRVQREDAGFRSDGDYSTLALGCSAAGSGTLTISKAWSGLATATYPFTNPANGRPAGLFRRPRGLS